MANKRKNRDSLDVLLPVRNEVEALEPLLRELDAALRPHVQPRFIVCEGGSTDGTLDLLERLRDALPLRVLTPDRPGYAYALAFGMRHADSEFVLALDSDGQCDPADFEAFWAQRADYDVLIGRRQPRRDPLARRLMSAAFAAVYRPAFGVTVHDPSCPFLLMRRDAVAPIFAESGGMPEGLWWEVIARSVHAGLRVGERRIHHRPRATGESLFTPTAILPIAARQVRGAARLWWTLARRRR